MSVLRSTQLKQGGRQLWVSCLSILGTAGVLYWLEGGFPPTSWAELFFVYLHFEADAGTDKNTFYVPLLFLFIQSFLLLLAWILLIWIAVRELLFFINGAQYDQEVTHISLSGIEYPQSETLSLLQRVQMANDLQLVGDDEKTATVSQAAVSLAGHSSAGDSPYNVRTELSSLDQAADWESGEEPESSGRFGHTVFDDAPERRLRVDSTGQRAKMRLRGFRNQAPPSASARELLMNNPFDRPSSSGIPTRSGRRLSSKPLPEDENLAAEQPQEEPDDMFVFGNPFEGPLPDVFTYDKDLQRDLSVMEEEMKQQQESTRTMRVSPRRARKEES